jgi:hypothetical protein
VCIGGATGRLVKLCQRQRRVQLETSRLLLLRDGDGRQERFLGWRGIRRIALEQNIAADAVALSIKPTLSRVLAIGDNAVDSGEGSLDLARFHFPLGQRRRCERNEVAHSLLAAGRDSSAHFREPSIGALQMPTRPRPEETAVGRQRWHSACAREVDESIDMRRRSSGVPAHHLEHGEVEMPIDGGADVTDSGRARYHLLGDFTRPINLAKRPEDQGLVGRYGNAEVLGKTKGKVAIALRIKDRERAFERNARICKISSKPVRGTVEASSDTSLWRPRPGLDFALDNTAVASGAPSRALSAISIAFPRCAIAS